MARREVGLGEFRNVGRGTRSVFRIMWGVDLDSWRAHTAACVQDHARLQLRATSPRRTAPSRS